MPHEHENCYKLNELLQQNQQTKAAQQQTVDLSLSNLQQQRANLEESLNREEIVPKLRQQNLELLNQNRQNLIERRTSLEKTLPTLQATTLKAIGENRRGLRQRFNQVQSMLPTLKERLESRRRLFQEGIISQDVMLNAQQEYFDNVAQISDIEAKLKQLDVQEADIERQYQQNLNEIDETNARIQQIDVQKSELQRQYLQSLNQIDDIKAKIEEIRGQEAKLNQQNLESTQDRANRIQEVRRKIAQLQQEVGGKSRISSPYTGRVLEVAVVPGQLVDAATRVGTIETAETNARQEQLVSLAYFANKDGKKIEPGMKVQVTPSVVKRERYGGIVGEVVSVSPFPVTKQNMATVIGSDNLAENIAESITRSGGEAPVQAIIKLETNPNNTSGYQWSSSTGPAINLSSGTTAQIRVKVGELPPISYVIPILRSLTGIY